MIKIFFNLLVLFSLSGAAHALDALVEEGTLEIRTSAFVPFSKRFSDVYGDVGASVGIEATGKICGCYNGWIDLDFFPKSKRQGHCCKSQIDIYNASFGINYFIPISCGIQAYIGIGPSISRIHIKNHSYCCKSERISRVVVGGIIKTGVYFDLCDPFYLNIFADYLYQPIHFHHTVDLGGIKAGIGLGIRL